MSVRGSIKGWTAELLQRSGLAGALGRTRGAARGPVVHLFGYHRPCADDEPPIDGTLPTGRIRQSTLDAHIRQLKSLYELRTLSGALRALDGSEPPTSRRSVAVITFDDGYTGVLSQALPVLQAHDVSATAYVCSGVVRQQGRFIHDRLYRLLWAWAQSHLVRTRLAAEARGWIEASGLPGAPLGAAVGALLKSRAPDELEELCRQLQAGTGGAGLGSLEPPEVLRPLSVDELRQLADAGVEIGAHTPHHTVLTHLSTDQMTSALREDKQALEAMTGRGVTHFAYCNGHWSDAARAAVRHAGFRSAVTTEDRPNDASSDRWTLGRRVLWEGSARVGARSVHPALLRSHLDGSWRALGFTRIERGRTPQRIDAPERSSMTHRADDESVG